MYLESSPGVALERTVECCWRAETDCAVHHGVRPDGCIDIVYSRHLGLRAIGAMTTERRFEMPAGSVTIGVRFRPGMAKPFLRISPAELTDRDVALQDLWGSRAHSLQQQLGDRPSEHVLAAALAAPPAPDPVKRSIELLTQSRGDVELEWLAAQAGLSPRQFRRRCLEESGLSPKQLCRILRFRHACELAAARAQSWAAIAADAGYFDQAHLIHDFQELTGRAPMSVFSNPRAADTVHNRA